MTANDNKSYLPYLNKLVDQYNTTTHIIILLIKNPLILIVLLGLKKLTPILKLLSLKLIIESELLSIKISLVKVTLRIGQEKYLLSILF